MGINKVYICGKVTGTPIAECTMKFGAAQMKLENNGFKVINPLQVVNSWKMPWKEAMRLCIAAMLECKLVYVLPDWRDSKGAICEVVTACYLGMLVVDLKTKDPIWITPELFMEYLEIVKDILNNRTA